MPLDFSRSAQLFMGTEEELAKAMGLSTADLRALRTNPGRATSAQLVKLGRILAERGRGMMRVGQMLVEDHGE